MRLLLDESVPRKLKRFLPSHEVHTVQDMSWSGERNGRLPSLAAQSFDAFITVDKNLPYQQDLRALPIAVVVLEGASIKPSDLRQLLPALERSLRALKAGAFLRVTADN